MAPKHRGGDVVAVIPGQWISHAHTAAAYIAFVGSLVVGMWLHYYKIVQNEHFGYPEEWFPSVSATIGDRYPERAVFQLFIAVCSGPRFILVFLWYCLTNRPNSSLPKFVAGVGIFRTFTCGGWTYVTSTDDHDWHDIFMISYLVATLPWTLGCLALSPPNPRTIQLRKYLAGAFFGTLVPLIYFFIQHKIHKVAGAYTIYAFFEWALVLLDVAFDAVTALDFAGLELVVHDIKGLSRGDKARVADTVLEKEKDKPIGQVFSGRFSWDALLTAVADVYLAFVFWSILTSMGIIIWYFPLWHMGISGYEVAVMSPIGPLMLGIPPLRRLLIRYMPVTILTTITGLAAYLIVGKELRLGAVSFSVWMGCTAWVALWYADRADPVKLEGRIAAWAVGLIMSSVVKFAWQTNNPIWAIMNSENGGWNKTGILLFLLALAQFAKKNTNLREPPRVIERPRGSFLLPAAGIGGIVFALHSLLSDSSTMISWVWEGYPVRGPIAVPHGAWTIFVMAVGLLFGLFRPQLARSWTAFGLGSVGAAVLTLFANWTGFYGGLLLTFYLLAILPSLISNAIRFPPARTFALGFFIYNFMVLFHVWVVAYAFVPGGPYVREHTDWIMITTMLLIGAGVFSSLSNESRGKQRSTQLPPNPAARKQRSYYIYILIALQLMSVSVAYLRFPENNYEPYHKDAKALTAGIWTIHFSLDNDMWSSEKRMVDLIRDAELDVVGLLESDTQRIIMGNRDFTQNLAEELGMYVDFGPGPNKHTWGAALLSKFPIVNSTHHLLPSPVGELAPAIEATIDAYGQLIDIYVFHSGQEEDPEDRRQQMVVLSELMRKTPRPAILLSYLVMTPHEGNYNYWVSEKSGMQDIDPTDPIRWCEYILYKWIRKVAYARVSRSTITDTELQMARFIVGEPEGSGEFISEAEVPENLRLPALFRGDGVRGHRYHDIEPRYFA